MPTVHTSVESARGCGFRKGGGLYLVSGELSETCPRLPHELTVCPCCGEGIKPARGFTWVDGGKLLPPDMHGDGDHWTRCPLGPNNKGESRIGRCGLIWVGEAFYPTAHSFMAEAARMGVSRRISQVPREFKVGETWVLLAHRKAVMYRCPECEGNDDCPACEGRGFVQRPGVMTAFKPVAIEYVVKGDEDDDELRRLEKRGFRLVRVIREGEQLGIGEETDDED